ncbi:Transcriptional repressor NrdR like [Melia azedarach]|uniref:Transcriptional repressor NrdR like n=1 Tax=Melia azedarach TaxID=155640 RepID=A0ACC1XF57_MELAZ|nr:Transcriptional repressor NrdR like [Melia azedarach]
MDNILPSSYHESLKRYWRRRKYQRVYGKRKIQVLRLGGGAASHSQRRRLFWRIRRIPRLRLKIISPIKLLRKFHDAYVNMMICLANKIVNSSSNGGLLRGKKVAKAREIMVSSGEEVVDARLVMEIYKKLTASRQLISTDDQL